MGFGIGLGYGYEKTFFRPLQSQGRSRKVSEIFFVVILSCTTRGAFSIVKKCVSRKDGKEYAAKIISKKDLSPRG